jgi:hypothetical protein
MTCINDQEQEEEGQGTQGTEQLWKLEQISLSSHDN